MKWQPLNIKWHNLMLIKRMQYSNYLHSVFLRKCFLQSYGVYGLSWPLCLLLNSAHLRSHISYLAVCLPSGSSLRGLHLNKIEYLVLILNCIKTKNFALVKRRGDSRTIFIFEDGGESLILGNLITFLYRTWWKMEISFSRKKSKLL